MTIKRKHILHIIGITAALLLTVLLGAELFSRITEGAVAAELLDRVLAVLVGE